MKAKVFEDILKKISGGESASLTVTHDGLEYTRCFLRNDRLIILGGGHVGLALCGMAAMLDFSVTVVDDRPAFANTERFSQADCVICDSFENAIQKLRIRDTDYVCVLTRGHRWDQTCVEAILSGSLPRYFGMIGSRRRVKGMKEDLIEKGYDPSAIETLHAPIGLDIGAQTPAEIALSISAQMIETKRSAHDPDADHTLFAKNTDIDTLRFLANGKSPRAMMLVLTSDGSTPVDSGSLMAIDLLGSTYGTIGGGCSEAAAIAKARRLIGTDQRAVIDIDMSSEVAENNGMVCGGCMTVLIEDVTD